jgi:tetratricopeptide (TPR) repeat protein
MKLQRHTVKLFLSLLACTLFACSTGPQEKPVSESFSSPARLLDQGISQYNLNNYPEAIDQFEKALLQYRSIDNQAGIASSCLNLAKTHMAINHNQLAAEYLLRANTVIEKASLTELNGYLYLLRSSLAINNGMYDQAIHDSGKVLDDKDTAIKLAALKNRTNIAFLRNDSDRQQWLQKYKALQENHPDNRSHAARILRFEAEASNDAGEKVTLLSQSLAISHELGNRTAIAATLTQWAHLELAEKQPEDAEDKYLRALFIRHQLGDVKNTLAILKQLHLVYDETDQTKAELSAEWIKKLGNGQLSDLDTLLTDLDNYPNID